MERRRGEERGKERVRTTGEFSGDEATVTITEENEDEKIVMT